MEYEFLEDREDLDLNNIDDKDADDYDDDSLSEIENDEINNECDFDSEEKVKEEENIIVDKKEGAHKVKEPFPTLPESVRDFKKQLLKLGYEMLAKYPELEEYEGGYGFPKDFVYKAFIDGNNLVYFEQSPPTYQIPIGLVKELLEIVYTIVDQRVTEKIDNIDDIASQIERINEMLEELSETEYSGLDKINEKLEAISLELEKQKSVLNEYESKIKEISEKTVKNSDKDDNDDDFKPKIPIRILKELKESGFTAAEIAELKKHDLI